MTEPLGPVVKSRAIQCALSRICARCDASLTWPIAFIGTGDEVAAGLFHHPPMHVDCALSLLGDAPEASVTRTGGFDLVRPTRRGEPVLFHPNSVILDD